jgi:hypothetical protein
MILNSIIGFRLLDLLQKSNTEKDGEPAMPLDSRLDV